MTAVCELAAFLRAAGPVRMPSRMCCVAALVGREAPDAVAELCETRSGDVLDLDDADLLTPAAAS
ncbi:hypothetical protein [Paractinoplanes atraurantiacus]|uniref:Uncharacterized protein n=1 Tax=Paractinoplanes atraurantiacus TaxID=1036182 RepID=A0A285KE83_9ACTN|nr:hypothetical protein [Actinoplanes atraurantiacus]SNY70898.1 hypothetical protein SAMN05421748_13884 [Actinoplanes atraurantiacus]